VIIASGDMSHRLDKTAKNTDYKFNKYGPKFERLIQEKISTNNVVDLLTMDGKFIEQVATCAMKPLAIMYGFFDGYEIDAKILSYEQPYGVGYLCAKFESGKTCDSLESKLFNKANEIINIIKKHEDEYVKLARQAVEYFLTYQKKLPLPPTVSDNLLELGGVFVSLHTYDSNELRGCIGTITPTTDSIGEEIIRNAIVACSQDQRFPPLMKSELNNLVINVDVLSEMIEEQN
jgi:hypothetical protein